MTTGSDLADRARRPRSSRDLLRWAHLAAHRWAPIVRPRNVVRSARALAQDARGRRSYRLLSDVDLLATRTSDTVFVFGSGRSLLDITPDAWERIGACQTIAFSEFHRNEFVRIDYHLINEVHDPAAYGASIAANRLYAKTIFVAQAGWHAHRANQIVGERLLPPGSRLYRYRRVGRASHRLPTTSLAAGLSHGWNSSFDAVNLALLLGWTRIVLTGVDMYDRRYSYLEADETRPQDRAPSNAGPFRGVAHSVELYGRWRIAAEAAGVELSVYDARSAVAAVLPVFQWG